MKENNGDHANQFEMMNSMIGLHTLNMAVVKIEKFYTIKNMIKKENSVHYVRYLAIPYNISKFIF